ncbi:MAG: helix-turn-helix domain-containing protein [Achromobacter sp.]|jgi:DNA-binding transcriptional MerR regulator|uniref:helix-turn-helix domain-containing protein n=1 Tax=Achromobacter sp. TaxID=134375 RepID=UPI002589568D|nr:helix-turn-helix domain-containing protein [Achromobacter sp.]MCW0206558.1 helix-turn-helix domain-containing protein [Achromobacter sp.]
MSLLDIGVLSRRSGVPASTLRYYEEVGLIQSRARRGLRRQYGEETLTQLMLIFLGKTAGFSLQEIGEMFDKDGAPNLPRPVLHERADALERQIRRLAALKDTLRHVADCPAPSHMQCPHFQKLLRISQRELD